MEKVTLLLARTATILAAGRIIKSYLDVHQHTQKYVPKSVFLNIIKTFWINVSLAVPAWMLKTKWRDNAVVIKRFVECFCA